MMFLSDDSILTNRFATEWAASPYASVPVDYPGKKVTPSDGKVVRFRIGKAPTVSSAVGDTRRRNFGTVMVQIVLPSGGGSGELLQMADKVSDIFKRFKSGGLRCRPASMTGPSEDGSFIMGTVDVPYQSDYSP